MPQIKFGLAPAGSAADLEEEDPAWATRVLRFDPEYKFALASGLLDCRHGHPPHRGAARLPAARGRLQPAAGLEFELT